MTESSFQSRLLAALKRHEKLREAVIYKFSDRFTRGIPDIAVVVEGRTTWLELKVEPNRPTKIQAYYLKRLQPRAHVVTLTADNFVMLSERETKWDFATAVELIVLGCVS